MTSRRRLLQGLALTSLAPRMVAAAVPENWTQTFEVIVVGGGGAGLAASVAAAQNGASVCLIEKLPLLGGDTLRSTGYFSCVEPRRQKLNGITDSLDLHYRQTMEAGGNLGNPKVARKRRVLLPGLKNAAFSFTTWSTKSTVRTTDVV